MTPTRGRATLRSVPNQPRTPLRSFRIPDELYEAAQQKAAEKGESVSDVVRRALERYVKRP
jgi:predicted HicB family RNase H-like nuclease